MLTEILSCLQHSATQIKDLRLGMRFLDLMALERLASENARLEYLLIVVDKEPKQVRSPSVLRSLRMLR